jgi:phage tail sheath protein FI
MVTFPAGTLITALELQGGTAIPNVQEYPLGVQAAVASSAQIGGTPGQDGIPPNATDLIGSLAAKTGIFALENVDLFNLLCIPRTAITSGPNSPLSATQAQAVMTVAEQYCESRRAFFLMDTPLGIIKPSAIQGWLAGNNTLRDNNAALYFPRVDVPDPLNSFRLRSFGPSGTIAGLCARIDSTRGVWKAPAGTEATLVNVPQLDYSLTDGENGVLNPLAINCLRNFPVYGNVCWGARTLEGADQIASDWKYIPVRRFALFLEESLYRGTKWAVFEPNDEPLWSQIRLNIGAFMQSLFRQGAFQGSSPRDAYFVKCDKETTTQTDINNGIVNIVVGFAPLKPAEFVILKIQQIAGQIPT